MWKTDYLKALGLPTEQVDAIKDVSLIKDVPVFYAEGSSTKPRCLASLD